LPLDHFYDTRDLLEHLVVPESQHDESGTFQQPRPSTVLLDSFAMLAAVDFDHEHSLQTRQIEDVVREWMLATELAALDLSVPQVPPQRPLGICRTIAQLLWQARRADALIGLTFHTAGIAANTIPTQPSP
jgi:hypothetical protein